MKKEKMLMVGSTIIVLITCFSGCVEQEYTGIIKDVTSIHGPERDAYGYYNWSIVVGFEDGKNITLAYLDDHYYGLKRFIGKKVLIKYDGYLESIEEME